TLSGDTGRSGGGAVRTQSRATQCGDSPGPGERSSWSGRHLARPAICGNGLLGGRGQDRGDRCDRRPRTRWSDRRGRSYRRVALQGCWRGADSIHLRSWWLEPFRWRSRSRLLAGHLCSTPIESTQEGATQMSDRIGSAAGVPALHRRIPRLVPLFNPVVTFLLAAGVPMGFNGLVTIRGRKSGLPRTTPVAIIEVSGRRWVWAP